MSITVHAKVFPEKSKNCQTILFNPKTYWFLGFRWILINFIISATWNFSPHRHFTWYRNQMTLFLSALFNFHENIARQKWNQILALYLLNISCDFSIFFYTERWRLKQKVSECLLSILRIKTNSISETFIRTFF